MRAARYPSRAKRQTSSLRWRQRGVVFYLFVVLALLTMAALTILPASMTSALRLASSPSVLEDARAVVLAQFTQPSLHGTGARLGQMVRLPDLPVANGPGEDATEPAYDGLAESTGCAYRVWSAGQAMRQPVVSGAAARCFGRIAWRELGLTTTPDTDTDADGVVPWLIMSPNLASVSACLPDLNPLMLAGTFTTYACPSAQPYPWLTVLDPRGNVVNDRVAFALILPGPPVAGQTRTATAAPNAWLDTITVSANCTTPCRPGTYSNAGYTHADNQPWQLIQADSNSLFAQQKTLYTPPANFNDRLVFVTVDELMEALEQRARRLAVAALETFSTSFGFYPYAAPLNSYDADCQNSLRLGHLPANDGDCGAGQALTLPALLLDGGWQRYFLYSVSANCNAAATGCTAPGLTLDSRTDIDALLISPGSAIRQAPWAISRGGQQSPVVAGALSANTNDWLDTVENAGGSPDVFVSYEQGTGPRNDRLFPIE